MRFCTQCGSRISQGTKFCANCGASVGQLQHQKDQAAFQSGASMSPHKQVHPTVPPSPTVLPVRGTRSDFKENAYTHTVAGTDDAVAGQSHRKTVLPAIAAVIAVVVTIGGLVLTNAYGGGSLPEIPMNATAEDARVILRAKGYDTVTKKRFSAEKAGSYIGLEGAEEGQKMRRGSAVTVIESQGPGVPKGVVGSTSEQTVHELGSMGVRVDAYPVVSMDPGKVVATYPLEGEPLRNSTLTNAEVKERKDDSANGGVSEAEDFPTDATPESDAQSKSRHTHSEQERMMFAYGVKGDGVPVEVYGMDSAAAKRLVEGRGAKVSYQYRPASRSMVGKVVAAEPAIGQQAKATQVTLYVGADAKGLKESLKAKSAFDYAGAKPDDYTLYHLQPLIGDWCTKNGDCLNLSYKDSYNNDSYDDDTQMTGLALDGKGGNPTDLVSVAPFAQAPVIYSDNPSQQNKSEKDKSLYWTDNGAFELYNSTPFVFCGTAMMGSPGRYCDQGVPKPFPTDGSPVPKSTGTTYSMNDFLLVVPVGANIEQLEKDGYFEGTSDSHPDSDRPYILKRDPASYADSEQTVSADSTTSSNPFIPNKDSGPKVRFSPAPNADNAYYYVEPTPYDWDTLPNGTRVCERNKCDAGVVESGGLGASSNAKESESESDGSTAARKTAVGMSADEIRRELKDGDYSIIAGTYCTHDGKCITIDNAGKATPNAAVGYGFRYDEQSTTLTAAARGESTWLVNDWDARIVELDAPDSDYHCPAGYGKNLCHDSNAIDAELWHPIRILYYPAGVQLDGGGITGEYSSAEPHHPPKTDRPFLQLMAPRMNPPVADELVYYLQN